MWCSALNVRSLRIIPLCVTRINFITVMYPCMYNSVSTFLLRAVRDLPLLIKCFYEHCLNGCVCLCVHVHACGCVFVSRLGDNLWCYSQGAIHLFIEFSLAWYLPSWSGWLASKPQGICLSLSPQCRNYKHMPPHRLFKSGFWRLNIGPYTFKVAFYRLTYLPGAWCEHF